MIQTYKQNFKLSNLSQRCYVLPEIYARSYVYLVMEKRGKYVRSNKGKPFVDKSGIKYEMLTVIEYVGFLEKDKCKEKKIYWRCACDCGGETLIPGCKIGRQKSCGCLKKPRLIKDKKQYFIPDGYKRLADVPEYSTWTSIKARCYRKTHVKFNSYGGRGIKVCDRWLSSFESFFNDMGSKPTASHSIDRIDVNGNYTPGNCRWATISEQANNKRQTVWITYNGLKCSMKEFSNKVGCKYSSLQRLYVEKGISIERIMDENLLHL